MASILDKFKINTAVDRFSTRPIDSLHITTSDFMCPTISRFEELVPKTKVNINMHAFARMNGLLAPTFGAAKLNNRAFFVPMHTIWPQFGDFITNSIHVSGETGIEASSSRAFFVDSTPLVSNLNLVTLFGDTSYGLSISYTGDKPDFVFSISSVAASRKFTPKGRQIYKLLRQMGYRLQWDCSSPSQGTNPNREFTFSALPLFAFLRIYLDWYYPAAYYSDSNRTILEGILKTDTQTPLNLTLTQLVYITNFFYLCQYDSDYFVSAFDRPTAPNGDLGSTISIKDMTLTDNDSYYSANTASTSNNGTPILGGQTSGITLHRFTQFGLDSLKKLTDYMKRHQLAGGRALDRYLSRFGLVMADQKIQRSKYLGNYSLDLRVNDVMSTADTTGASLGSYAGQGIMASRDNGHFEYDTNDDYGFFVIVSSIVPRVGYVQGLARHTMHKDRFSFWTPEFDGLGTQLISKAELFTPMNGGSNLAKADLFNTGFGFTSRYAEYKSDRDMLTGDFECASLSSISPVTGPQWHLFRLFDESSFDDNAANMVHNPNFVLGMDKDQYNRIFSLTDENAETDTDHFVLQFYFNGSVHAPMCGLYDDYDFDDNGKTVTVESNGVKLN